MLHNAHAIVRTKLDAEDAVDALVGYHPGISPGPRGQLDVVISLPAETLRQAINTSLAVLEQAVGQVTTIEVMTTDDYDARQGLAPMPELLSVTETAHTLGISRQAVLQRLESGSLHGSKVGNAWAIQRASIDPSHPDHPFELVKQRRTRQSRPTR